MQDYSKTYDFVGIFPNTPQPPKKLSSSMISEQGR